MTETPTEPTTEAPAETAVNPLTPWHGALTVEGRPSGDGRQFTANSLTHRPMTDRHLPLNFQRLTGSGHDGSETVAMIEGMGRAPDGLIWGWGHFRQTPTADEVIGLIADFGRFGVSIDADDTEMEVDEELMMAIFTKARIAAAAIVGIPALHEAFVALGEMPEDIKATLSTMVADEYPEQEGVDPIDPQQAEEGLAASAHTAVGTALVAAIAPMEAEGSLEIGEELFADAIESGLAVQVGLREDGAVLYDLNPEHSKVAASTEFIDVAPGKTEDGPGWLTHPEDTNRLRNYWVHGEGAAKIAWGIPGDFNRCRLNLAEYVKPEFLNGYCANRHYDALGVWPGQELSARETLTDTEVSPSVNLVAAVGHVAPAAWFRDPELSVRTPLTVTAEGRVFGHIAEWGTCHLNFRGVCVTPPFNHTNYSRFRTGATLLDDGTQVAVGHLTVGGGHAPLNLRAQPAVEHYDATSSRAADVVMGEDGIGIWVAGWVPPGTPDERVTELRASAISGDWRKIGGQMELIAALAVNSPGFFVQRPSLAASGGEQISLVAAGMIEPEADPIVKAVTANMDMLAELVVRKTAERQANLDRLAALQARVKEHR